MASQAVLVFDGQPRDGVDGEQRRHDREEDVDDQRRH